MFQDYGYPPNRSTISVNENGNIQYSRSAIIIGIVGFLLRFYKTEQISGLSDSAISSSHFPGDGRQDIMFELFELRGIAPHGDRLVGGDGFVGLALSFSWIALVGVVLLLCVRCADALLSVIVAPCAVGVHATGAVDSFIYSSVTWEAGVVSPSYSLLLGAALSVDRRERVEQRGLTPKALPQMGLRQMGSSHAA